MIGVTGFLVTSLVFGFRAAPDVLVGVSEDLPVVVSLVLPGGVFFCNILVAVLVPVVLLFDTLPTVRRVVVDVKVDECVVFGAGRAVKVFVVVVVMVVEVELLARLAVAVVVEVFVTPLVVGAVVLSGLLAVVLVGVNLRACEVKVVRGDNNLGLVVAESPKVVGLVGALLAGLDLGANVPLEVVVEPPVLVGAERRAVVAVVVRGADSLAAVGADVGRVAVVVLVTVLVVAAMEVKGLRVAVVVDDLVIAVGFFSAVVVALDGVERGLAAVEAPPTAVLPAVAAIGFLIGSVVFLTSIAFDFVEVGVRGFLMSVFLPAVVATVATAAAAVIAPIAAAAVTVSSATTASSTDGLASSNAGSEAATAAVRAGSSGTTSKESPLIDTFETMSWLTINAGSVSASGTCTGSG